MKKILTFLCFLSLLLLTACTDMTGTPDDIVLPVEGDQIETRATYDNKFGEDLIPGQWEGYGVGDPFVMRFNGKYYLYASTKNNEVGVRAWVSTDLINWQQADTEGLPLGYVSNDEQTISAYAPEVMYYNGAFYMITSPGGSGHIILKASDPLGPFVTIADNLGESIDGSFFLDDNEQMYMMRASNNGIRIVEVDTSDPDAWSLGTGRTLDNTIIGSWTEGPYMIKRDGIYYMTFTGNNVTSAGYRIAYSTATSDPYSRESFTFGDNIVLSTDENFNGLGHSSTVLGPDLDSYYLAYHNLNNSGGPDRSFNLGRLLFNGTQMSLNSVQLNDNYVPALPSFYGEDADDLTVNETFALTADSTSDVFSAEFNFIGEGQAVFGYVDENNYQYIQLTSSKLEYGIVENGVDEKVAESEFVKTYDMNVLHTIRLSYRDDNLDVYFDNMNKLSDIPTTISSGKIGYKDVTASNIYATVFSNVAQGLSDELEVKQSVVPANLYVKDESNIEGEALVMQNAEISQDSNGQNGTYDLVLDEKGEYASYLYQIPETGFYGIAMTLPSSLSGKTIGIQIDDATGIQVTVPDIETTADYVNVRLTELELPAGVHYIRIYNVKDTVQFTSFELFKTSMTKPSFTHDLDEFVLNGATYVNTWKLKDDGHYGLEGNRQLLYFGDDTFTDVSVTTNITFVGSTQTSTAGIILRADNPAFSVHDTYQSIQGYYIGMNNSKVFISKYNYNISEYDLVADAKTFESGVSYELRVEMNGNTINVYIDDELALSYVDPLAFTHGRIGFYTEGAGVVYDHLVIE